MASRGINKVILVGNLGNDPEVRYMPNGNAVANVSLATSDSWKDKATGEQQEKTEWHRVVFFNRLAEIVEQYVKKGSKLYIEILQQMDYLKYIDHYHEFIKMFHVKDAEFNPNGKSGVYGGYQDWIDRPGRFRSLGDGQVDFKSIFSKLSQYDFDGWAILEWECCIKSPEQGAKEGSKFIKDHIIEVSEKAFDDFASGETDQKHINDILGL